jgi:26S proteasome non-ATPase regulatory subunit 9
MSRLVSDSSASSVRDLLRGLDAERLQIEEEVAAIVNELNSPGVNGAPPAGVSTPLVDAGGFPRADVDLYHVRERRNRLACLRTDHKALMAKLESALIALHQDAQSDVEEAAATKATIATAVGRAANSAAGSADAIEESSSEPFCQINDVLPGSPAAQGGLRTGDLVIVFGGATAHNHRNLAAIADVVRDSVGSSIEVIVQRSSDGGANQVRLSITPMQWEGRGVLGCHFLPA